MKHILTILLILSCIDVSAEVYSVQNGNWSDANTWNTHTVPTSADHVTIAHTVTLDVNATVSGVIVNAGAILQYKSNGTEMLQSNKNVVIYGTLQMHPLNTTYVHDLKFINVDESAFVGGGMDTLSTDVGLWVMGAGKLDAVGTAKKSWTNATGSVVSGSTSFSVMSDSGWQAGDRILIVPTDLPPQYSNDWNDATGTLIDYYFPKFEERIITGISGNTISFTAPLSYDHNQVVSNVTSAALNITDNKTWTAEVANLSRNVIIEGTKDIYTGTGYEWQTNHRAHIFISSSTVQNIQYVECRLLGPRKLQNGGNRPDLVTGRYALHLHHCEDGSRGTVIQGCSVWNIGTRCYVPHVSHGITMIDNVAYNSLGEGFWYDFQDLTHDLLWKHNLIAAIRPSGSANQVTGMQHGEGDGNIAEDNVAVYCNAGGLHNNGGCYSWIDANEGVWKHRRNLAHSSVTAINIWQNSGFDHTIEDFQSYNCWESIGLGAYGNQYLITGGHFYRSPFYVTATNATFYRVITDAGGNPFGGRIADSPIPGGVQDPNQFINCVFVGHTITGLEVRSVVNDSVNNGSGNVPTDKSIKVVQLIGCDYTGSLYKMDENTADDADNKNQLAGYTTMVQPLSANAYRTIKNSRTAGDYTTSNISNFAPLFWGTGDGQYGDYYNGNNFNFLAFRRLDFKVMFPQWRVDPLVTPTGIDYRINKEITGIPGDALQNINYSIRWDNFIQAQYTEPYTFYITGGGKYKMWVNGTLIMDSPQLNDNATVATSAPVNMVAGSIVPFKIEMQSTNAIKTIIISWKSPSMPYQRVLPRSQSYTTNGIVVPPPPCSVCNCE